MSHKNKKVYGTNGEFFGTVYNESKEKITIIERTSVFEFFITIKKENCIFLTDSVLVYPYYIKKP